MKNICVYVFKVTRAVIKVFQTARDLTPYYVLQAICLNYSLRVMTNTRLHLKKAKNKPY